MTSYSGLVNYYYTYENYWIFPRIANFVFMETMTFSFCSYLLVCIAVHVKSLQSCPTLCNPMDCSLPGFSVQGILQARILEWVAMPSSRGSFQPRDWTCVTCVSCKTGRFFTTEPPVCMTLNYTITSSVGYEQVWNQYSWPFKMWEYDFGAY